MSTLLGSLKRSRKQFFLLVKVICVSPPVGQGCLLHCLKVFIRVIHYRCRGARELASLKKTTTHHHWWLAQCVYVCVCVCMCRESVYPPNQPFGKWFSWKDVAGFDFLIPKLKKKKSELNTHTHTQTTPNLQAIHSRKKNSTPLYI